MSKKFFKQVGNIVFMQAVGYAVGEAFRVVGPKVKKAMGLEEAEPSPSTKKEEKKTPAKDTTERNREMSDLIRETKASVAKKKEDVPASDANSNEGE